MGNCCLSKALHADCSAYNTMVADTPFEAYVMDNKGSGQQRYKVCLVKDTPEYFLVSTDEVFKDRVDVFTLWDWTKQGRVFFSSNEDEDEFTRILIDNYNKAVQDKINFENKRARTTKCITIAAALTALAVGAVILVKKFLNR